MRGAGGFRLPLRRGRAIMQAGGYAMDGYTTYVEDKLWGSTRRVYQDDAAGWWVDHATIYPGGFSSIHKHQHCVNKFQIVSGALEIRVFGCGLTPTDRATHIVRLNTGQAHEVPAGHWHQFVARGPVQLIEVYWKTPGETSAYRIPDITRSTTGGRDGPTRPWTSPCRSGMCGRRSTGTPSPNGGNLQRQAPRGNSGPDASQAGSDLGEGAAG